MKLSAIGDAISTPSASPTHQVSQSAASSPPCTVSLAHSAKWPTLVLTKQASKAPNTKKRAMSRGSDSVSGCGAKRRTSAAPAMACKVAPAPMASGRTHAAEPVCCCEMLSAALVMAEPMNTPAQAARPYTSTAASAMPAAGNSGDA